MQETRHLPPKKGKDTQRLCRRQGTKHSICCSAIHLICTVILSREKVSLTAKRTAVAAPGAIRASFWQHQLFSVHPHLSRKRASTYIYEIDWRWTANVPKQAVYRKIRGGCLGLPSRDLSHYCGARSRFGLESTDKRKPVPNVKQADGNQAGLYFSIKPNHFY
ncbi:hypothetical protein F5Y17DRAFT_73643 [Xylariaceae sp. FL0594]|nr:hypothetical protein F5Y17DRAFT_73643 [Xylariaceae sp. FL0594]